jgi:broad specificity phosphatase PhoE
VTLLLLIRHARSIWNAQGRWQGQADPPLDEQGRQQARALAHHLRHERLDAVYSSPLERARETAEAVAHEHRLAVIVDDRLKERHVGAWSGLTEAEVRERYPDSFTPTWWVNGPPGGESQADVTARALAAVEAIHRRHADGLVAVVSHGGTLNAYLRGALHIPMDHPVSFRFENTTVARVRVRPGEVRLLTVGETSHLGSLPAHPGSSQRL